MIKDSNVEKAVDALIKSIKESDIYTEFDVKRREVAHDDGLRNKIYRTREIRNQVNRMSEYEKDGQLAENLMDEYDELLDNTAIHEFSISELEFCALYREVLAKLVNSFELDIKG